MSYQYQRPQFHNYPLKVNELRELNDQHQSIEREIKENNNEIKILNLKIAKTDYDEQLLARLRTKEQILMEKKRELDEIMRTQGYIEEQIRIKRMKEGEQKEGLANQYKMAMEQKKRKMEEEKKRQIVEQRNMQVYNNMVLDEEYKRKRQQMQEKRQSLQEELTMKSHIKQKEKEEHEMQKQKFNQKVEALNYIQTQKDSSYRQYYQHFLDHQNKLQNMYQNQAAVLDQSKDYSREQFVNKNVEEGNMRSEREERMRLERLQKTKQQLRMTLQRQMEEKEQKSHREKEEEGRLNSYFYLKQRENVEIVNQEKERKKEEQKRYEEMLAQQLKMKQMQHQQQGSGNASPRGYSLHNPITNPIDFKIGITNPYIVQNYENTKQRYLHDNNGLKLRNLAMIGNKSLGKWPGQ